MIPVIKEYVMRISSYGTTNRHFNNNTNRRFYEIFIFRKVESQYQTEACERVRKDLGRN